jgi:hypothetical protein
MAAAELFLLRGGLPFSTASDISVNPEPHVARTSSSSQLILAHTFVRAGANTLLAAHRLRYYFRMCGAAADELLAHALNTVPLV